VPDGRLAPPEELPFCTDDREQRVRHTYGRSYRDVLRGFHGDFGPAPDLVAHPRTEDDVAAVLAWASAEGVAVVPYGGGTSVVGGLEIGRPDGFAGTLSLDMRAMDRVLAIDETSLSARIEAGALGPRIEEQLAPKGLTLRHFPQSFEHSTLGGWIATRAGGHFATVYTHIDDLVESVRMLTPRGPMESRRLPGSGAGPSPDRLVLGSEGAFGVITEAWMRVRPRPRHRLSASVRFGTFEAAVDATRAVAQAGLHPSNCRLLDAREALLNGVPAGKGGVLLLGFESVDAPRDGLMEAALLLCSERGGVCKEGIVRREEENEASNPSTSWRKSFLDAPYLQSALVSLGVIADTFETAITWERFAALHERVIRAVKDAMAEVGTRGVVSCRFTHVYPDGPAPYYTFLAPGREGEEQEQWAAIKSAAADAVIDAGGTITHHHAVGRMHRPWIARQRPALFTEALCAARETLDPRGIMNPGVLL
jgi:alkyldihydroxyacetonephosphate synthase